MKIRGRYTRCTLVSSSTKKFRNIIDYISHTYFLPWLKMCSKPTSEIEADGIKYRFETLDSKGDVIFSVHNPPCDAKIKLLACSRILTLTLPVFSVIFNSNFQEGIRVRRENRPVINLEKRDVQTMELLLRILHH